MARRTDLVADDRARARGLARGGAGRRRGHLGLGAAREQDEPVAALSRGQHVTVTLYLGSCYGSQS